MYTRCIMFMSQLHEAFNYMRKQFTADCRRWTRCFIMERRETCSVWCVGRWYGTPSYMVQGLFSHYQGVQYMATAVEAYGNLTGPDSTTVAASVTCQDELCAVLALKVSGQPYLPSFGRCEENSLPSAMSWRPIFRRWSSTATLSRGVPLLDVIITAVCMQQAWWKLAFHSDRVFVCRMRSELDLIYCNNRRRLEAWLQVLLCRSTYTHRDFSSRHMRLLQPL